MLSKTLPSFNVTVAGIGTLLVRTASELPSGEVLNEEMGATLSAFFGRNWTGISPVRPRETWKILSTRWLASFAISVDDTPAPMRSRFCGNVSGWATDKFPNCHSHGYQHLLAFEKTWNEKLAPASVASMLVARLYREYWEHGNDLMRLRRHRTPGSHQPEC